MVVVCLRCACHGIVYGRLCSKCAVDEHTFACKNFEDFLKKISAGILEERNVWFNLMDFSGSAH